VYVLLTLAVAILVALFVAYVVRATDRRIAQSGTDPWAGVTRRMRIEALLAIRVVVTWLVYAGRPSTSTETPTSPQSQASCALARAREMGISAAAMRRDFPGEDLCSFSSSISWTHVDGSPLTPSEKASLASPRP
jgi:hypothetical protein